MCVILSSSKGDVASPTDLWSCYEANPDGIGIAWLTKKHNVRFIKGISYGDMISRMDSIGKNKQPYILHFRVATIGERRPQLCHPFPVTTDKQFLFSLQGETNCVLAHNGTWRAWPTVFSEDAVKRLEKKGWSDSAMIAWLLGKGREVTLPQYGYGHRIAVLSITKGLKLFGDWWEDPSSKVSYSNRHWQNSKLYGDSCSIYGSIETRTSKKSTSSTIFRPAPVYAHHDAKCITKNSNFCYCLCEDCIKNHRGMEYISDSI